jgi:hypothetical protein
VPVVNLDSAPIFFELPEKLTFSLELGPLLSATFALGFRNNIFGIADSGFFCQKRLFLPRISHRESMKRLFMKQVLERNSSRSVALVAQWPTDHGYSMRHHNLIEVWKGY